MQFVEKKNAFNSCAMSCSDPRQPSECVRGLTRGSKATPLFWHYFQWKEPNPCTSNGPFHTFNFTGKHKPKVLGHLELSFYKCYNSFTVHALKRLLRSNYMPRIQDTLHHQSMWETGRNRRGQGSNWMRFSNYSPPLFRAQEHWDPLTVHMTISQ